MSLEERRNLSLDFSASRRPRPFVAPPKTAHDSPLKFLPRSEPTIYLPVTAIPPPIYLTPQQQLSESDQEAYTQGFVDALLQMHRTQVASLWLPSPTMPSFVLTPVSPFASPIAAFAPLLPQSLCRHPEPMSSCLQTPTSPRSDEAERASEPISEDELAVEPSHHSPYTNHSNVSSSLRQYEEDVSRERSNSFDANDKVAEQEGPAAHAPRLQDARYLSSKPATEFKPASSQGSEAGESTSYSPSSPQSVSSRCPMARTAEHVSFYDDQEHLRLERRREKNRYAARKCRTKKLERISHLEDKVQRLTEVIELSKRRLGNSKELVERMQQHLARHEWRGCVLQTEPSRTH